MGFKLMPMGWDSNPCPHQPVTYTGIEVAAILKRRTALDYSNTAALCWFKHFSI